MSFGPSQIHLHLRDYETENSVLILPTLGQVDGSQCVVVHIMTAMRPTGATIVGCGAWFSQATRASTWTTIQGEWAISLHETHGIARRVRQCLINDMQVLFLFMHTKSSSPVMRAQASSVLEVETFAFRMLVANFNTTWNIQCGHAIT